MTYTHHNCYARVTSEGQYLLLTDCSVKDC
jgi:hypothetical protein